MSKRIGLVVSMFFWMAVASCGGAAKETAGPKPETPEDHDRAVTAAQDRVRAWISHDLAARLSQSLQPLGRSLGRTLARDQELLKAARSLGESLIADREVKAELTRIGEKATSGFTRQLSLGLKILQDGGPDAYAAKVRASVESGAVEALAAHLQTRVLTDDRMIGLLEKAAGSFDLTATFARYGKDDPGQAAVSRRILDEVQRLTTGVRAADVPGRIDAYIASCGGQATPVLEKLSAEVGALPSVTRSVRELSLAVLRHKKTHHEAILLIRTLLKNKDIENAVEGVYEAALFEKGEKEIRKRLDATMAIPALDDEIFKTLGRLAASPGAGPLMARHLGPVATDKALTSRVETSLLGLFDRCKTLPAEKLTPPR